MIDIGTKVDIKITNGYDNTMEIASGEVVSMRVDYLGNEIYQIAILYDGADSKELTWINLSDILK